MKGLEDHMILDACQEAFDDNKLSLVITTEGLSQDAIEKHWYGVAVYDINDEGNISPLSTEFIGTPEQILNWTRQRYNLTVEPDTPM